MSILTIKTLIQLDDTEIVTAAERRFTDLVLVHDQEQLASLSEKTMWSAFALGAQQAFTVLLLTSDQPVELELVTEDLLLERQVNSVPLGKNVAFVLTADEALYDYGAGVGASSFTGTLGNIDKIRVREVNGVIAKVRLRLYR